MGFGFKVLVAGPRACFTRPELKAERVSYDVMTPSAARGILEAIYWKPAIVWRVDSIEVINPVRFDTFRRNEVSEKGSYGNAKTVAAGKSSKELYIDVTAARQQRATMYLRDVCYVINAHFEMTDKAGPDDSVEKHYNIALRRLRSGQCFYQPFFGCREFAVSEIRLIEEGDAAPESFYAEIEEKDFGFMLFDIDFNERDERGRKTYPPMFYRAVMRNGIIDVPSSKAEVIR